MIFPYQDDPSNEALAAITLTLDVRCTGDDPVLVTSDDLRSEDPAVLPVGHPHARGGEEMDGGGRKEGIIIAKLRKGQALRDDDAPRARASGRTTPSGRRWRRRCSGTSRR